MRLSVVLLLTGILNAVALPAFSQQTVTISVKNAGIIDVIKEVERQSGQVVIYNTDMLVRVGKISIERRNSPAIDVLNEALKGTGLVCKAVDENLVISQGPQQGSQSGTNHAVTGQVVDKNRQPLIGATIRVKGTNRGVATDAQGRFQINVSGTAPVLTITYMGMKEQEVPVTDPTKPLTVVMEDKDFAISDVIVTGVFDKPRESYTGAVSDFTKEDIRQNYSRNILQTLSILEPSFRIISDNLQGSNPNALPEIQLRGQTSMATLSDITQFNSAGNETASLRKSDSYIASNTPLFIMDGFEIDLERFSDLNEEEIDRITILKDAAATSLYGPKGANGVIIITTYRPDPGKLSITYRATVTINIPDLSSYNMMNAMEKLGIEKHYGVYDNEPELYDRLYAQVLSGKTFDWLKYPVRTGVGQNHSVGLQGGADKWRYRVDANYEEEKGPMKGSDRSNFNGTMNLFYTADKFRISQSLSVGMNKSHDSQYGSYSNYVTMNPYWYPYDDDGQLVYDYYQPWQVNQNRQNPLYDTEKGNWSQAKYTSFRSNTQLVYDILPELRAQASFGFSRSVAQSDSFIVPSHTRFNTAADDEKGLYSRSNSDTDNWQARLNVNYSKLFNDKHLLTVGVNGDMEEKIADNAVWSATGFTADNLDHVGMAMGYSQYAPSGEKAKTRRVSLSGSVNYSYDGRYFCDASYSTSGGSSWGRESRFGDFWSVGAGWNIHQEGFIKDNVSFINEARAFYSYGISGTMGFAPSDAMEVYALNTNQYNYLGIYGFTLKALHNPDLKWQSTKHHSTGMNIALFQNRINLSFGYYNRLTINQVTSLTVPISHGFSTITGNMGDLRNEGYEYGLSAEVLRTPGGLRAGINGRFARNINTIVRLSDSFKDLLKGVGNSMTAGDRLMYREGYSTDAIYGLRTLGVDPNTGQRLFIDKNGAVTLAQNGDDQVHLGDRQSKLNGNASFYISYRGFTLNCGFNIKFGGYAINETELSRSENASIGQNLDRRFMKDVWQNPGDRARYSTKNIDMSGYTYTSDMFVQKDNVFSCSHINLSYSFPSKLLERMHIGMSQLTLNASLSDIFYLSTIRRERGTAYPYSLNPNFSISCTF